MNTNKFDDQRQFFRDARLADDRTHRIYSGFRDGVRVYFCETLDQEWSGAVDALRWVYAQGGRIL